MAAATDRVLIETLLFTGIRNSELCRIRLKDVQLGAKDSLIYIRGKCRERRSVHIPAALDSLLTRFIKVTRPALLKTGVKPSDPSQPLFINEHHRAFERTTLYRRVVRILTEAGMGSRASVQLLRHTYGYLAYLKTKGNLLFVQRQLGHAHPMITSIYAQFVEEPYDQMANQIVAGLCD
jgi:site-specific recombinase XerD